jgi:hypothetical protein
MNMATQEEASPLAKFDAPVLRGIEASAGGAVAPRTNFLPSNFAEAMELAKVMAAGNFVPPHLRGVPGDCLAVVMQSSRWGMDPFAVGNKTYFVNNRMAYESQLVAAVVNSSGRLKETLDVVWEGEGEKLKCIVTGTIKGETRPKVIEQEISTITTRNSPLWKQSPRVQLAYYTQRAWARVYTPEVLLGVYSVDEIEEMGIDNARQVGPAAPTRAGLTSAKVERVIQGRTREQQAELDAAEAEAQAKRDSRGMTEVDEEAARALDAGEQVIEGEADVVDETTGEVTGEAENIGERLERMANETAKAETPAAETPAEEPKPKPRSINWDSWITKFEREIDAMDDPAKVEDHYESKRARLEKEAPEGVQNRAVALRDARVRALDEAKPKEEASPADEEPAADGNAARADEIIASFNKCEILMDLRRQKLDLDEEIDAMPEADSERVNRAFKAIEDKLKGKR